MTQHVPVPYLAKRVAELEEENAQLRSRVAALTAYVNEVKTQRAGFVFNMRLRPREQILLAMLMEKEYVTRDEFMQALYTGKFSTSNNPHTVAVHVCRLRTRLKEIPGASIENVVGRGYHITHEARKAIARYHAEKSKDAA